MHSLGAPIYLTEEHLLQCTGNYSVMKYMHERLKELTSTPSGKGTVDKIKHFMTRSQYDKIHSFFPKMKINFIDSISFGELTKLQQERGGDMEEEHSNPSHKKRKCTTPTDVPSLDELDWFNAEQPGIDTNILKGMGCTEREPLSISHILLDDRIPVWE